MSDDKRTAALEELLEVVRSQPVTLKNFVQIQGAPEKPLPQNYEQSRIYMSPRDQAISDAVNKVDALGPTAKDKP